MAVWRAVAVWWHRTALRMLRNLGLATLNMIPMSIITLLAGVLRFYSFDALRLRLDEGFTLSVAPMPGPRCLASTMPTTCSRLSITRWSGWRQRSARRSL